MPDPEPLAPLTSPIVRDLNILSGRPVFRGTRVPVDVLFDNLADGLTVDEVLESYPSLNRDDVLTALDLGRQRILGSVA
jgi:uncharacterized protein (DUF433 family)